MVPNQIRFLQSTYMFLRKPKNPILHSGHDLLNKPQFMFYISISASGSRLDCLGCNVTNADQMCEGGGSQAICNTNNTTNTPTNENNNKIVLETVDCPPGFWGVDTCHACLCSRGGSVSETCDMITGQCSCKPGHTGQKMHKGFLVKLQLKH